MTFERNEKPPGFSSYLVGWITAKEKKNIIQSPDNINGENPGDVPGIVEIEGPNDPKIDDILLGANESKKDVALATISKKKWVLVIGTGIVLSAATAYGVTKFIGFIGNKSDQKD